MASGVEARLGSRAWPWAALGPKFKVPSSKFKVKETGSKLKCSFHGTRRAAGWRLWKRSAKTSRRQRVV
jgi:hypothetical protein